MNFIVMTEKEYNVIANIYERVMNNPETSEEILEKMENFFNSIAIEG